MSSITIKRLPTKRPRKTKPSSHPYAPSINPSHDAASAALHRPLGLILLQIDKLPGVDGPPALRADVAHHGGRVPKTCFAV